MGDPFAATRQRVAPLSCLSGHRVAVIGAAPGGTEHLAQADTDRIVAVNGGIGSVPPARRVDVWCLNAREYDDALWDDPQRWPEARKVLHAEMLAQGAGRDVGLMCWVVKGVSSAQTAARIRHLGTTWDAETALGPDDKAAVGVLAGLADPHLAFRMSTGLLAACLTLLVGASSVALCGFSTHGGYAFTDRPYPVRQHLDADLEALTRLQAAHPGRLTSAFSPQEIHV